MQDVGVAVEQNLKLILNLCRQQLLLYDGHLHVWSLLVLQSITIKSSPVQNT